jgi:Heterokaryon incompatibility protein (HET)
LLETYRTSGRELQCRITHVKLEELPRYDAISYTWGDPKHELGILVDGKWLNVTRNVYELLQDRASSYESRSLWIDCICINQTDDDEKSSQVPMMYDIYRQATRVIIWLGLSSDAVQAFSLLEDLYERPLPLSELPDFQQGYGKFLSSGRAQRFAFFDRYDPRFAALARLLKHGYFLRLWIMQEIAFGEVVHVRCGSCWISWIRFSGALMLLADIEHCDLVGRQELSRYHDEPSGIGQIVFISVLKDRLRLREQLAIEKSRLCDLLVSTWMTRATDARDMIYGLLNLSRESNLPELSPEYKKRDAGQLYTEVARHFLNRSELLDTLYVAGIGYPREVTPLPSWVPDWSCAPKVSPLRCLAAFRVSNGTVPQIRLVSPNLLSVRGLYLDKISATLSEPFQGLMDAKFKNSRMATATAEVFRKNDALELVSSLPDIYLKGKFNNQARNEALWRTLIGDTMIKAPERENKGPLGALGVTIDLLAINHQRPAEDDYGRLFEMERRMPELFSLAGVTRDMPWNDVLERMKALGKVLEPGSKLTSVIEATRTLLDDHRYDDSFCRCARGRKFAITNKGYMSMVPPLAKAGDDIGIIYGAEIPFVFRRDMNVFDLIGECYVHGIMDGEALQEKDEAMSFLIR